MYISNKQTTYFLEEGNFEFSKQLSPNTYKLCKLKDGYSLEVFPAMEEPPIVYGDFEKFKNKVLKTYNSRKTSTGVLLFELKGTGKTLLVNMIANEAIKNGMPVIFIADKFDTNSIAELLAKINQEIVVVFDEFDKNFYDTQTERCDDSTKCQDGLLSLMDGVFGGKKLFLITCNELRNVSEYLLKRPGRIFYFKKFGALPHSVVSEYVNETCRSNMDCLEDVADIISRIPNVTFDIMQAVVEECNRFPDTPIIDLLEDINIGECFEHEWQGEVIPNDTRIKEGYMNEQDVWALPQRNKIEGITGWQRLNIVLNHFTGMPSGYDLGDNISYSGACKKEDGRTKVKHFILRNEDIIVEKCVKDEIVLADIVNGFKLKFTPKKIETFYFVPDKKYLD